MNVSALDNMLLQQHHGVCGASMRARRVVLVKADVNALIIGIMVDTESCCNRIVVNFFHL
jgi:hypothetical protein